MMEKRDGKLYLRDIHKDDKELLFQWVNDSLVRSNAFHTEKITMEEHQKWFLKLLDDKKQRQYILMKDDLPVGQVRLEMCGTKAGIDYSIAYGHRGNGYGKEILKLITAKVKQDMPQIHTLVGKVKCSNRRSEKCFINAGFKENYKQFELNVGREERCPII